MHESSQQELETTLSDLREIENILDQRLYELGQLDFCIRKMFTMSKLYTLSMIVRTVRMII